MNLKLVSNLLFALSFLLAILLFTHTTFGHRLLIRGVFLASGGIALLLSLIATRIPGADKTDFNLLFWIGSLLMYIGFVMRFEFIPGAEIPLIGGLAVSAISNFYQPFQAKKDKNDDLLDN